MKNSTEPVKGKYHKNENPALLRKTEAVRNYGEGCDRLAERNPVAEKLKRRAVFDGLSEKCPHSVQLYFNHAIKYYGLQINPAQKAGNMGSEMTKEMLFWTKEEYLKFIDTMMDKAMLYYAFEVLYWCGIREGELLALTPADFDFEKKTLRINKSYQRIGGEDVVTTPKTACRRQL